MKLWMLVLGDQECVELESLRVHTHARCWGMQEVPPRGEHQQEHMLLPDFFLVTSRKVSQVLQVHQSYWVPLFLIYFLK